MEEVVPVANHVQVAHFLAESAAIGIPTTFPELLVVPIFRPHMGRHAFRQPPSKVPRHVKLLSHTLLRYRVAGVVVGELRDAEQANMIVRMHTLCSCYRSIEVQVWGGCTQLRL